MDKGDWERRNADLLDGLRGNLRAELWRSIGLDGPMPRERLAAWAEESAGAQPAAGDRVRLYLPAAEGQRAWESQEDRATQDELNRSNFDATVLPIRRGLPGVFWVDTFTGLYLGVDLADPARRAWPDPHRRSTVPHVALVALAALDVVRLTGAVPAEATAFLLCDIPCGRPFQFSWQQPGGLRIWAWDAFMPGEELKANYMAWRRAFTRRNRAKRPEPHTLELIRLVAQMRRRPGRDAGNASWGDVCETWNATHERKKQYKDAASISRAHAQALRRRRKLGLLPADDGGDA